MTLPFTWTDLLASCIIATILFWSGYGLAAVILSCWDKPR